VDAWSGSCLTGIPCNSVRSCGSAANPERSFLPWLIASPITRKAKDETPNQWAAKAEFEVLPTMDDVIRRLFGTLRKTAHGSGET
jgi:hypothetical protein